MIKLINNLDNTPELLKHKGFTFLGQNKNTDLQS